MMMSEGKKFLLHVAIGILIGVALSCVASALTNTICGWGAALSPV